MTIISSRLLGLWCFSFDLYLWSTYFRVCTVVVVRYSTPLIWIQGRQHGSQHCGRAMSCLQLSVSTKRGEKALDSGGTSGVALAKVQVEHWLHNQKRYVMSFFSVRGFQQTQRTKIYSHKYETSRNTFGTHLEMNYSWRWLALQCRKQSEPFQATSFTSFL